MPRYGPGVRLPDRSRPEASGRCLVPGAFATLADPLIPLVAPPRSSPPAAMATREAGGSAYRSGSVLGLAPFACYIRLARDGFDGDPLRAVLPVLRPEAVQLPTAVRIGPAGPWPVQRGDPVRFDATGITLGNWLITPARSWHPPRVAPVPTVDPAAALDALSAAWPDAVGLAGAPTAQAAGDPQILRLHPTMPSSARRALHAAAIRVAAGVDRPATLVGLGPGLTPSGDDALAGALLALRLLGREARVGALAARLTESLPATTDLSGSLLLAAAGGYAAPQVVDLLKALGAGDPPALLRRRVAQVVAIGHSSGADLLTGIHAALAASADDHVFQPMLTKESR